MASKFSKTKPLSVLFPVESFFMTSVFKKHKTPDVPNAVTSSDVNAQAAAQAETDRIKKRRGLYSTWLTGPQGMNGSDTGLKTKLGE